MEKLSATYLLGIANLIHRDNPKEKKDINRQLKRQNILKCLISQIN